MKNNFSSLVKQEMVNRFESVVKDEINANNRLISETNKSLEQMRKEVDSFKDDYEKLKNSDQDLYNRLSLQCVNDKIEMENKFKEHITATSQNIEKFFNTLLALSEKVSKCLDKDAYKSKKNEDEKAIDKKLEVLRNDLHISQMTFETLHKDHLANVDSFFKQVVAEQEKFTKRLVEVDVKFAAYMTDFSGLLKEIRVYKRENFIANKEIEKLYILIDRLEKRIKS